MKTRKFTDKYDVEYTSKPELPDKDGFGGGSCEGCEGCAFDYVQSNDSDACTMAAPCDVVDGESVGIIWVKKIG